MDTHFLNPGELIYSKIPIEVKTILGSCVAVTLFDTVNKTGGICHYLIAEHGSKEKSTKYGNVAIQVLLNKFLKNGSEIKNLEANVVGGSLILFDQNEIFFTGDKNVDVAFEILKKEKIKIKIINVGGSKGRSIVFHTNNGNLFVRTHTEFDFEEAYLTK